MSNLRLAFILEAIDKATAPMRRVSQAVDQINEPAKRVSRSMSEVGFRFGRLMGNRLSRQWGDVAESGQKLRDTSQGIAHAFGAVSLAAGGAFYAMKRTVDEVDHANDQAKMLGMTTEKYQQMGYAAQLNGSSQEAMGESLKFLNENMTQAISGSKEATLWFARVGIPIAQLKKMNAGQVFEAIADKFHAVGDAGQNAANKIAVTKALMGRGGTEMKQVLDQGSAGLRTFYKEADRVGAVVSNETADAMAGFNDNFDRLKFSIFGVMAAITKAALPALDAMVKKFTELNITSRAEWGETIGRTISGIVNALPGFLKSMGQITGAIVLVAASADMFAQALGGWQNVIYVVSTLLGLKLALGVFAVTRAVAAMIPTIWSIGAAIMATPIGWFMAAIALLAGAAFLVYRNWTPIKEFFVNLWGGVKDAFMVVYNWISEKFGAWLKMVGKVVDVVKGVFSAGPGVAGEVQYDAMGNPTGTTMGSALPAGAAGKTDIGGTLKIQIDQDGRARVASITNNNKNVDFDVYSGMTMVGP